MTEISQKSEINIHTRCIRHYFEFHWKILFYFFFTFCVSSGISSQLIRNVTLSV